MSELDFGGMHEVSNNTKLPTHSLNTRPTSDKNSTTKLKDELPELAIVTFSKVSDAKQDSEKAT